MGNFLRDLDRSKSAVNALMEYYESKGFKVEELVGKAQQKHGDFAVTMEDGDVVHVEVKFDMYAKRSGNLCFEMSNGSKETGIMTTLADKVYYVVPTDEGARVFVFDPEKLRTYIQDPTKVTIKNGGDKRKFILALAKITSVVEDELPQDVFDIT